MRRDHVPGRVHHEGEPVESYIEAQVHDEILVPEAENIVLVGV